MLSLILIQGGVILLGTLIFVLYDFEFLPALFEVTSAMATVGLSTGIVSPEMSTVLKGTLIILMWMGRIQIFPVLTFGYTIFKKII